MQKIDRNAAIVLILLAALPAFGAAKTAGLTGSVTDSGGEPLDAVEVVVLDRQTGAESRTTTDSQGGFELRLEEPEHGFVVRLSRPGFRAFEHPVELSAGKSLQTNWILLREEEAAARDAETARIEAQNRATVLYNEAADLYNEKDYEGAIARFHEALGEDAGYEPALAGLARAQLHRRDFAAALDAAERYRGLRPGDAVGARMLYDALWGLGEIERAERVLEELAAAEPGTAVALRMFNRAAAAVAANDLAVARSWLERGIEMDPTLHQAAWTLAQIHEAEEDFARALEHVDRYLQSRPGDVEALMLRHRALRALDRDEQAGDVLAELRSIAPEATVQAFHERGVDLFDRGLKEEALAAFEAAVAVVPDHAPSHFKRGMCLVSLGRNGDARAALERFLTLSPDSPDRQTARDMLSYLDK